jgi:stage II sporulation protein D
MSDRGDNVCGMRFSNPGAALLMGVSLIVSAACAGGLPPTSRPGARTVALPQQIRVRVDGRVRLVRLEEYVAGTALAELSPVGESPETVRRVLEVQSVITRTYALSHLGRHQAEGFDLCDSTHCQVFQPSRLTTSRFSPLAQAAAADTAGQVLLFGARPAETLFHADCGGHTADAHDVWGGNAVSYLRGGPDDLPDGTHRAWTFAPEPSALLAALNSDTRTAVGATLEDIVIVNRDDSGRAADLELRGSLRKRVRGDSFRAVLSARFGALAFRSTRMRIERDGRRFTFSGTGYGHGVGLCQVGATARARRGETLDAILGVYYPGSRLGRAGR